MALAMAVTTNIFSRALKKITSVLSLDEYVLSQDKSLNIESSLKVKKANIRWKITNFNSIDLTNDLESPVFRSEDKKFSWYLVLQLFEPSLGNQNEVTNSLSRRNYLNIKLIRADETDHVLPSTKVSFCLLNSNTEKVYCVNRKCTDNLLVNLVPMSHVFDKKYNIIDNGCITILCELNIFDEVVHKRVCEKEDVDNKIEKELLENFNKMMVEPNFSDITLEIGEKQFRLHKVILSARSPVFEAMFRSEMQEFSASVLEITTTPPGVMQEVIRYIYTGKIPRLKLMALDLFKAADYWSLEGLKEKCLIQLQTQLNIENAVYMLELADTYNEVEFRKHIMRYITSNEQELINTKPWKELVTSRPDLMDEIYRASVNKKSTEITLENTVKATVTRVIPSQK